MCWSFEWSLGVGVYCYLIAIYLMKRNRRLDQTHAAVLVAYSSIQFVDAILWYDESQVGLINCSVRNRFTTSIVLPSILSLELIVSAAYSLVRLPRWWNGAVVLGCIAVFNLYFGTCTTVNEYGLLWGDKIASFAQFTAFYVLLMRPRSRKKTWLGWIRNTWWMYIGVLVSVFIRDPNLGSKWCYYAALLSFFSLLE